MQDTRDRSSNASSSTKPAKVLCEASSGFFRNTGEPRTYHLTPSAIAKLGKLGFSTDDSQGNFKKTDDTGERPEFNAIADLILTALHDAYDVRVSSKLKFESPFAPQNTTTCIPLG